MKAKRRVVTSGVKAPTKRRPTVRRIKPAIRPLVRRPEPAPPSVDARNGGPSAGSPSGWPAAPEEAPGAVVELSVDLGRGLRLENPILVASGTFGYGIEYGDVVEIQRLGAICCKGTTLRPGSATRRRA